MTRLTRRIIELLMRYYIRNWRGDRCQYTLKKGKCPICQARNAYDTIIEFSFSQDTDD